MRETTKERMKHTQTLNSIYQSEEIHRGINTWAERVTYTVCVPLTFANPALGISWSSSRQAVQEMSGSIADAFHALGKLYNDLGTRNGLYVLFRRNVFSNQNIKNMKAKKYYE
jgi:hypothetical protein